MGLRMAIAHGLDDPSVEPLSTQPLRTDGSLTFVSASRQHSVSSRPFQQRTIAYQSASATRASLQG
jgi:hypothetical protein